MAILVMLGIALAIFLALTVAYIIVSYQDAKRTQEHAISKALLPKSTFKAIRRLHSNALEPSGNL